MSVARWHVGVTLGVAVSLAACAGNRPTPAPAAAPIEEAGPPDWVMRGSGAFMVDGARAFCGVGSSAALKSPRLTETTAANRGRAEISKLLDIYGASMAKAMHAEDTTERPHRDIESRVDLEAAAYRLDPGAAVVRGQWTHKDGTTYVLIVLELEALKTTVRAAPYMDAAFREYVLTKAENYFDDLAAEEAKRRQPSP